MHVCCVKRVSVHLLLLNEAVLSVHTDINRTGSGVSLVFANCNTSSFDLIACQLLLCYMMLSYTSRFKLLSMKILIYIFLLKKIEQKFGINHSDCFGVTKLSV